MKIYRINFRIKGETVDEYVFETAKVKVELWFDENFCGQSNSLTFEDIDGDFIFVNLNKYDIFYIEKE